MPPAIKTHGSKRIGETHAPKYFAKGEKQKSSSSSKGYNYRWQRYRAGYLRRHPLCAACFSRKRYTPATEVDHIVPHKGDFELFWDPNNHQGLCKSCHSKKTASEDGGFGNKGKVKCRDRSSL